MIVKFPSRKCSPWSIQWTLMSVVFMSHTNIPMSWSCLVLKIYTSPPLISSAGARALMSPLSCNIFKPRISYLQFKLGFSAMFRQEPRTGHFTRGRWKGYYGSFSQNFRLEQSIKYLRLACVRISGFDLLCWTFSMGCRWFYVEVNNLKLLISPWCKGAK